MNDELVQIRTKKKKFLAEIYRIVPLGEWIALIQPYYYKGESSNKPYDLERMLRIYLVQNLYNLSDLLKDVLISCVDRGCIILSVRHYEVLP